MINSLYYKHLKKSKGSWQLSQRNKALQAVDPNSLILLVFADPQCGQRTPFLGVILKQPLGASLGGAMPYSLSFR
ncbi:hypothetical protein BCT30_17635 [Enterovibrio norvegicus]|nr:hypothetical protein A1OS_22450 [Enterovibrio norvegicus]OEF55577.1 hypothetical protein A1OU_24790 [Enterovibrio norvegicus]OEF63740.1 hypothetical protein A1OW_18015 [Enterovibrio norvegicus]PMH62699.1 hypothetical protein BCU62_19080 [Enterovibrio norvegicus]PMI34576.1 hypothetical protein BCU47_05925 [Enterovibrio norvegicus]